MASHSSVLAWRIPGMGEPGGLLSLGLHRVGHDWSDFAAAAAAAKDHLDFPGALDCKEFACIVGDLGSIPGLGKSPGGGYGNPLQYSCLENPHGQRRLVGCNPWGCKESDTTEWLSTAQHTSGKEPTCQCRRQKRLGFDPWVGKIPWRRAWQPILVFLLGESPWTKEPTVGLWSAVHGATKSWTQVSDWAHTRLPAVQPRVVTYPPHASTFSPVKWE